MAVVIVGLEQAMAKIAAIPAVAEASGKAGIAAGAQIIAARARGLAPRRTGALAASVHALPDAVVVTQPYAGYVERGTSHMAAQPYLGEAVEQEADAVGDAVTDVVRAALYAL